MKTVRLEWRSVMMRRIRMRRIETCGGPPQRYALAVTTTIITIIAFVIWHRHGSARLGGGGMEVAAPPGDIKAVGVGTVAEEGNDVAGVEAFVFDVTAPAFGQHVALAAVPIRVTEAPVLAGFVLETQQVPLVVADAAGGIVGGGQREVLLGVLLGDHQTVQLPHVARRQRLLEHRLLLVFS